MEHACRELSVSERRACRVLDQSSSTQRHRPVPSPGEQQLRSRIIELARKYGRYGYRRITAMLWREGWQVNHKKMERIWRQEGLKVPKRQPATCRRLPSGHDWLSAQSSTAQ